MSLLESFIECCEREREDLHHQLARLEFEADNREVEQIERLKQDIADLDSIIEARP